MSKRRDRSWLRAPAKTIKPETIVCPLGLTRYDTLSAAQHTVSSSFPINQSPWQCSRCRGGFHNEAAPTD